MLVTEFKQIKPQKKSSRLAIVANCIGNMLRGNHTANQASCLVSQLENYLFNKYWNFL